MMEIKQVQPPEKIFTVTASKTELEEIRIAFNHMLGISFYTNLQHDRVAAMRDVINKALSG